MDARRAERREIANPTLYRLSCVIRLCVDANFGLRDVRVHDIHALFKPPEVLPHCSYTRSNEDAVEPRLLEAIRGNRLCGCTTIGQVSLRVIPEALELRFVSVEGGLHLGGVQAGASCVVGRRELTERWRQATKQTPGSCGHTSRWKVSEWAAMWRALVAHTA
jgi:hypothetical protein